MSEEEKRKLEAFIYWVETNTEMGVSTIPDYICKNIINLISKQQKKNSVSKDKIREILNMYSMNLEFDYRPMEVIETKEINKLLEE